MLMLYMPCVVLCCACACACMSACAVHVLRACCRRTLRMYRRAPAAKCAAALRPLVTPPARFRSAAYHNIAGTWAKGRRQHAKRLNFMVCLFIRWFISAQRSALASCTSRAGQTNPAAADISPTATGPAHTAIQESGVVPRHPHLLGSC